MLGGAHRTHSPPGSGIPASSGNGFRYTPGSDSCDVYAWSGTTLVDAGWNLTVFNTSRTPISGNELVHVRFVAGCTVSDFEACYHGTTARATVEVTR